MSSDGVKGLVTVKAAKISATHGERPGVMCTAFAISRNGYTAMSPGSLTSGFAHDSTDESTE